MLISADPAPNASLNVDPAGVTLIFDQELTPLSTIDVTGPSGTCVQTSPVLLPSDELSCAFAPGDLLDGTYTVTYTADPSSGSDPATTDSYDFVLDTVPPGTPSAVISAGSGHCGQRGLGHGVGDVATGPRLTSRWVMGRGGVTDLTADDVPVVSGSYSATFDATLVAGRDDHRDRRSTDAAGNTGSAGHRHGDQGHDPAGDAVGGDQSGPGHCGQPGLGDGVGDVGRDDG